MKKETIEQIILTADEGMYLTNGDTYGTTVVLPKGADVSQWYEITKEKYERIMKEQEEALIEEGVDTLG